MIRAILFDLGKVIVPFDFSIAYQALERRCGLPPAAIRERIRESGLVAQFETGLLEPRDFVSRLCRAIGTDISYSDFCDLWSAIFSRHTLISEQLLVSLHLSCRLILVSNTNAIHFEMIRESYPLLRHFDALVLSYQVKAMKPSPEIFRAAVKEAGCLPEECFFTDDIAEYVEAAKSFGIDAVQFESAAQVERDLRIRGVAF